MAEAIVWARDMGFSRDEFVRVLPRALAVYRIEMLAEDRWRISEPEGALRVDLRIDPRPQRRIGALSLPVLAVRLNFAAGPEAQWREFLRRFEQGFQKGGG